MSDYIGLSKSIFDEPEYRDGVELLLAIYFITHRDMAGVVPIRVQNLALTCHTSPRKILSTIDYFESIHKLVKGGSSAGQPTHICWLSGIYHSLYRGKFSKNQLGSVVTCLWKWNDSGLFNGWCADGFANGISQLYESKYNLVIPIPKQKQRVSDRPISACKSESESETEYESEFDNAAHNAPDFKKDDLKIISRNKNPEVERLKTKFVQAVKNGELEKARNLTKKIAELLKCDAK